MTKRCCIVGAALVLVLLGPARAEDGYLPPGVTCPLDADQEDLTVWPNRVSSGNSDPWIHENHDRIRRMRPRVLVLNFANNVDMAGNVHFPPGGRDHYDLKSPFEVQSTIENFRLRNGPGGRDKVEIFHRRKFERWLSFCPDGMGPWLVYWRQNMPGLGNRCVDDEGKPMKNWWPFLFY